MKYYIAGPMTGIKDSNYPAFNAAAARLRAICCEVENPAENEACESWLAYMRQALRQMLTCDVVVLLPGWERSRGANVEQIVARLIGLRVVHFGDMVTT